MLAELLGRQTSISRDSAHREGIDGIVTRNGHNALAVGHDDMLALARDAKADLLEHPDRVEVIDAREFGHALPDLDVADLSTVE